VSSPALQHSFRSRRPSLRFRFPVRVYNVLPSAVEVPLSGFGYPLSDVSCLHPREPLSAPNAPGLYSSELCSSPGVDVMFPLHLPLLRSLKKPSGLLSALQRLAPPRKAVPLSVLPEGLVPVRASCSPELSFASRVLPPGSSEDLASPHILSPRGLPPFAPLSTIGPDPQGLQFCRAWLSPSVKGADPSDVLHRLHPLPLEEVNLPLTIFSSRCPVHPYE